MTSIPQVPVSIGSWIVVENATGNVRLITNSARSASIFLLGRQLDHYSILQAIPVNMEQLIEHSHGNITLVEEFLEDRSVVICG